MEVEGFDFRKDYVLLSVLGIEGQEDGMGSWLMDDDGGL